VEGDDTNDVPTMSYNFVAIGDLASAEKVGSVYFSTFRFWKNSFLCVFIV
jgi:hypothetical protein